MKVALAHKRLDLSGGTERDLYRTAEGLRDLGHEVHIFCEQFGTDAPPGTTPHRIPVPALGRTARAWSFAIRGPRIIRTHRCDVVVGFGRMAEQDVVRSGGGTHRGFLERLGREGGRGRRLWQHVSLYHRTVVALEKRQFASGHFKKIVAVSDEVKRDIIQHYAITPERITVLYNGVDQERFHPSRRNQWRCPVRRETGIPEDAPLALFVGSGFRRKGLGRLLAVWNSPQLRDAYLLIVGEDARMGQYRARANAVSPQRIVFAGRQEAVEKYYGAADVVVLSSIQEAFGNVVLEGLASGLPVVVNRGLGGAEVLKGELALGVVTNPGDPGELAQKIADQLCRSKEPACREAARQLAESYSWPNHFRRLESALLEVCAVKQGERVF